jgi:hypothetical protein
MTGTNWLWDWMRVGNRLGERIPIVPKGRNAFDHHMDLPFRRREQADIWQGDHKERLN